MSEKRRCPKQKPGLSETVVATPQSFVDAAAKRYGRRIMIDLAASPHNAKARRFLTKEDDSLSLPWANEIDDGAGWLNPPYDHIGLWAAKCDTECHGGATRVMFLVPASVGSNWFKNFIFNRHPVVVINGRIYFVGHSQGFPKDLMLVLFGFGISPARPAFNVWTPTPQELGKPAKLLK